MKIEDLPRPENYRRQMAKNGGYEMVPAYTAEEVLGILEGVEKDAERLGAELWNLAVRKGIVTLHSERIDDRNQNTRCSWMQGNNKACDISNSAFDAAIKKGQV